MTTMTTPGQFTLESQNLGCLPIVNFFLTRIGLADHLRNYLPPGRRPAAADPGNGDRLGSAQPRGRSPPGLRTR